MRTDGLPRGKRVEHLAESTSSHAAKVAASQKQRQPPAPRQLVSDRTSACWIGIGEREAFEQRRLARARRTDDR